MADEEFAADAIRLVRAHGDRGPSLSEKLAGRLETLRFQAPWYRMRLKGRFPLRLLAVPVDPVPGDPRTGERLKAGRLYRAGHGEAVGDAALDSLVAPAQWRDWVHGWGWLRDLAAAGPPDRAALKQSEALARRWLERFPEWDEAGWAPAPTGRRILMAIAYAPLVMPGTDHIHRSAVLNGIARWARHLDRAVPGMGAGFDKAEAAGGLLGAALMLQGGEERQVRAEGWLGQAIDQLVDADGAAAARAPAELARLGDLLLLVEAFYAARSWPAGAPVAEGLKRVRAGLAGIMMGDGRPAAWHGPQPAADQLERLGVRAGTALPPRGSGYRLLAAGKVRVVVDAGPPPLARANRAACASTGALVMSDGAIPLVISCGAARADVSLPPALAEGLRSTAGHSALVLADTNSSRVGDRPAGARTAGVAEVLAEQRASPQGQWLEVRHDGWRRRFGLDHQRRLWLSPEGDDLRGEDSLLPGGGALGRALAGPALPVAIRFHLGPDVTATLTEDGLGALLRLPQRRSSGGRPQPGGAWLFRSSFASAPGRLLVEPSLMVAADGATTPIQHLLLVTEAAPGQAAGIGWSFRRA